MVAFEQFELVRDVEALKLGVHRLVVGAGRSIPWLAAPVCFERNPHGCQPSLPIDAIMPDAKVT